MHSTDLPLPKDKNSAQLLPVFLSGLVLGSGSVLAACGASSAPPLAVETIALEPLSKETMYAGKTLFIPGESMSFELTLRGVVGGRIAIAVGQPGVVDGRPVTIVRSRTQSVGLAATFKEVRDEIATWIDLDTGLVLKHEADSVFGGKHSVITSDMGAGVTGPFRLTYQRNEKPVRALSQYLPDNAIAFDIHAILGLLRAWQPDDGDEKNFFLLSGRRLWRSTLRIGNHETIRTSMGRRPAIRIDGVAQRLNRSLKDVTTKSPRHYSAWFSDDANRIPLLVMLKTEYGELRVELVDYQRPDQRFVSKQP